MYIQTHNTFTHICAHKCAHTNTNMYTQAVGVFTQIRQRGNNTLNGTQINVTQANNNSNGILVDGNGTFDLANTSVINISGTGTLSGIAAVNSIVAIGNHAITGSNVNVIVATDSADQAIGLVARNASKITLDGVDIDVSGNPSSLISDAGGGPITLTGTNVCILNGNPVACQQ